MIFSESKKNSSRKKRSYSVWPVLKEQLLFFRNWSPSTSNKVVFIKGFGNKSGCQSFKECKRRLAVIFFFLSSNLQSLNSLKYIRK